jgi:hypothetical protein
MGVRPGSDTILHSFGLSRPSNASVSAAMGSGYCMVASSAVLVAVYGRPSPGRAIGSVFFPEVVMKKAKVRE